MRKFYLALASGSQVTTANKFKFQNILINYQTKISSSFKRKSYHQSIFIDCGGFSSSLIAGGYRTSDEDYLQFVQKVKADMFALRDYPCEPDILKKWHRTVADHIEMTVNHHIKLLELCTNIEAKPIAVLQGWNVNDYLYCIDRFRDQGLITKYIAIGSICRRGSQKQIRKIVNTIREELKNVKLHGFGISLNALRYKDVWDSLYSADSGAWDFASRWRCLRGEMPKREATEFELQQFLFKLSWLKKKHNLQSNLGYYVTEERR